MTLDLFLASMMRDNSDLQRRLSSAGVMKSMLLEVRDRARDAGLLGGRSIPLEDYVAFFGTPSEVTGDTLRYVLRLWPDHLFEAGINAFGGVFDRGFVLKGSGAPLTPPVSLEFDTLRRQFRPGFHTMGEVDQVLGKPDKDQAWGAMEDWLYGPIKNGRYVAFEFDFRLLSAVQLRTHVSLDE